MLNDNTNNQPISALGLWIWFLAALFFLYEFFLRTFVGTVAHQIIHDLKLNAETFSLLGTAYFLAYGLMQIPVGILCDKFGAKITMIFATLTCVGATYLFAHAARFETAFLSRFLMGFGSSFAFVCMLVLVLNWLPRKYFGFFSGASQFIGTMGPLLAAGPLMTMINNLHESWQHALVQIGSSGMFLALLILIFVKNKPKKSNKTVVYLEKTISFPKQLKELVSNRQAWLIATYSALVYIAIAVLGAVWGTDYLEVKGLSQTASAYCISILWIGYAIGCPLSGFISDVIKRRKPLLILSALIGLIVMTTILLWQSPQAGVFGILFFLLGIAASGQNIGFAYITEQVGKNVKSTALGLNNGMITFSCSIIPPITGWILHVASHGNMVNITPHHFFYALIMFPVFYFAALIISLFFLTETYCKPQKEIKVLNLSHQSNQGRII